MMRSKKYASKCNTSKLTTDINFEYSCSFTYKSYQFDDIVVEYLVLLWPNICGQIFVLGFTIAKNSHLI